MARRELHRLEKAHGGGGPPAKEGGLSCVVGSWLEGGEEDRSDRRSEEGAGSAQSRTLALHASLTPADFVRRRNLASSWG